MAWISSLVKLGPMGKCISMLSHQPDCSGEWVRCVYIHVIKAGITDCLMSSDPVFLVKVSRPHFKVAGWTWKICSGDKTVVQHKLSMVMRNRIWFLSGTATCIDILFMLFSLVYRYKGLVLLTHSVSGRSWEPEFPWMRPTPLSLQCTTRSALPCRWARLKIKTNVYLIKFLTSSSCLCSQIILALLGQLQELDLLWGHLIALCKCDVSIANSPW